jgi:hypothetical protein
LADHGHIRRLANFSDGIAEAEIHVGHALIYHDPADSPISPVSAVSPDKADSADSAYSPSID